MEESLERIHPGQSFFADHNRDIGVLGFDDP